MRFPRCTRAVVALLLVPVALAVACRRSPPPAPAVSPDTWAVVEGRPITREAVEKAYRRATDPATAVSDEEALLAKLTILDEMILRELLLARAAALQIQLPDSELDAAYLEARRNMSDEDFQQELTRRNLTPGDMRETLRAELLAQKVLEREVTSKVTVTDQEIAAFFEANREAFNIPEDSWRLAQIVVTPVREAQITNRTGSDATSPQEAAQKASMIMERLRGGASFRDLAAQFSEDPESAARGGDLGLVPRSALQQVPAALREAVLTAEPGTVRHVQTGGLHLIVLVVGKEPAGQRDLGNPDVRQRITELLRGRREQMLRAAFLAALRTDGDVVNHLARRVVEAQGQVPADLRSASGSPSK